MFSFPMASFSAIVEALIRAARRRVRCNSRGRGLVLWISVGPLLSPAATAKAMAPAAVVVVMRGEIRRRRSSSHEWLRGVMNREREREREREISDLVELFCFFGEQSKKQKIYLV